MSKYVESFVKLVKGDDAETNGVKNQNKAVSLLKAQIAIKEAEKLSFLDDIESAKQEQLEARLNKGVFIGKDGNTFLQNLINAQEKLETAEENLENLIKEITFFKNELAVIEQ